MIISGLSYLQKDKYMIALVCVNLKKNMVQMKLLAKQKQSHRYRKQTSDYQGEGRRGINWETGIHIHTVLCVSHSAVSDFVTPWTVAHQAPLSLGFSRQEYWSGLPRPPPGDLPSPGIEPRSPALQADSLPSEPPGKPHVHTTTYKIDS